LSRWPLSGGVIRLPVQSWQAGPFRGFERRILYIQKKTFFLLFSPLFTLTVLESFNSGVDGRLGPRDLSRVARAGKSKTRGFI
jgi:hypothetical protein